MMDDATRLLADTDPTRVLLWSGAGVSMDDPTSAPGGLALTERALREYFRAGLTGRLRDIYATVNPERELPRLETVLEALVDVYGTTGLADLLSDLRHATPNANHAFLASHLRAGGRQVTANFDTCIERALNDPAAIAHRIVHFHGVLTGDLAALGARLRVIENGLPHDVVERLDRALDPSAVSAVLFVGYSGSDYFDATPYLLSRAPLLRNALVVVHTYDPDQPEPELASSLRAAGADVRRVSGPLRPLFRELTSAWSLPRLPEPAGRSATPWRRQRDVTDEQRERASLGLFALMGHRAEVLRYLDAPGAPRDARDWDRLADALWGAGRYTEAGRAWIAAFPSDSVDDRAQRDERAAAVLWIRGDLLAAERHLRRAMRQWVFPGSPVSAELQARIAETYGRVLTQMRRLPDVRWPASPLRVSSAEREIARLRRELGGREGLHLRARLDSVSADLARRADEARDAHVRRFGESEALHAWLNYEHGRLRRRVEQPGPADHPPTCSELRLLHDRQIAIGAVGDAARVYLLPTAPRCYSPRQAARELQGIDITTWHRFRLVAGFLAAWLLSRRPRGRRAG